jgi:hypothetical protein
MDDGKDGQKPVEVPSTAWLNWSLLYRNNHTEPPCRWRTTVQKSCHAIQGMDTFHQHWYARKNVRETFNWYQHSHQVTNSLSSKQRIRLWSDTDSNCSIWIGHKAAPAYAPNERARGSKLQRRGFSNRWVNNRSIDSTSIGWIPN